MNEKGIKPGDKVRVFDNGHQKIISIKVIQTEGDVVVVGSFPGYIGMFFLGFDCFLTRKSLCEHYRKIFE